MEAIVAGLAQGGAYAAFALSLSILFSMMRVINFAHGDVLTIGLYVSAVLLGAGVGFALTALAVVGVLIASGLVLYLCVFIPTQRAKDPALTQVFATVGVSLIIQNAVVVVYGADTITLPPLLEGSVNVLGASVTISRAIPTVVALVLAIGLFVLLKRTSVGVKLRAIAENRENASISGISVHRGYVLATVLSFMVLAVTALAIVPNVVVVPLTGFNLLVIGFLAVVIGGLGSPLAAVGGAYGLAVVESLTSTYLAPIYAPIGMYLLFIGFLLLRPQGLAGRAA